MKCPYCKSELNEGAVVCHVCRKKVKKTVAPYIIAGVIAVIVLFAFWLHNNNQKREEEWRNSPEGQYWAEKIKQSEERLEKSESLLEEIENIGKEYGIED